MPGLTDELNADQRLMIDIIYQHYNNPRQGGWPAWRYVRRAFTRQSTTGAEAKAVRASFPSIGMRGVSPVYSAIFNKNDQNDEAPVFLSLAAGLHHPQWGATAAKIVEIIRHFANIMATVDPSIEHVTITSSDLAQTFNWDPQTMIPDIPAHIDREPLKLLSGRSGADRNWEVRLGDEWLTPFKDVKNLTEYVETFTEIIERIIREEAPDVGAASVDPVQDSTTTPYVKPDLLAALNALTASSWDLHKLKSMVTELDGNYVEGRPYATASLIRAIIDHIPPLFGQATFASVINQVSLTTSKKKYLQLLSQHRFVADDVLHTPIAKLSKSPDVIDIHDMPNRIWFNTLLQLVVERLSPEEAPPS